MMATAEHSRMPTMKFGNLFIYFVLLIPAAVFGFWKTYFGILTHLPETVTPLIHIHALLMMVWLFMLIVQAWFIRTKRLRLHRWVGRSSYVIAPTIVLLGLAVIHEVFNRTPGGVPLDGFSGSRIVVLGFGQLLGFGLSWGLAIAYRKETPLHLRFMISTAFAIATAIVFRVFFLWVPGFGTLAAATAGNGAVLILLLLGLIAADWQKGMKKSPFWVVTIVIGLMHVGYWTFSATEGWRAFCQWYADFPW